MITVRCAVLATFLSIILQMTAQVASLDPVFNPADIGYGEGDGTDGIARCVALQSDGEILIGGDFSKMNDRVRNRLMRLHPDGLLDTTYLNYGAFNGSITTLAVQPDDRLICGGSFNNYITPVNGLVRLNTDGTPDASFNIGTGFNGAVYCSALQPDGRLLVGGDFTTVNGVPRNRIARLNADGTLDTTFDPGTGCNSVVRCMALQSDGRVLIGGNFNQVNGQSFKILARLEADGVVDATFATSTSFSPGQVFAIAVEPDGQVLVGGSFSSYAGTSSVGLVRLNADATVDSGFSIGTGFVLVTDNVRAIALQPDGRILVGGAFSGFNGTNVRRLTRLNADGTLDPSFPVGDRFYIGGVHGLALQPDGKTVVVGGFTTDSGVIRNRVARVDNDGTLDFAFGRGHGCNGRYANTVPIARCSVVQPDGRILVGGGFQAYNDSVRAGLVRIFPDGELDPSFSIGSGFDGIVTDIALQPDGKVVVCGEFQHFNGVQTMYLVRLNADGSRDDSFNMGTGVSNGRVYALALQPDGKLIAAGDMTNYNGSIARGIMRLNADGSIDPTFVTGNGFDNNGYPVHDLVLQPDGKVIACGEFNEYDNVQSYKIIRLNPDGSQDASFDTFNAFNVDATASCLALQPDGRVLVGGFFLDYMDISCDGIIRLNGDGTLDNTFAHGNDAGAIGAVEAVTLQSDGRVIVGGVFNYFGDGTWRKNILRLEADGTLDDSFDPLGSFNSMVSSLTLVSEEQLLVGGAFTRYQGIGRNRLMRMHLGVSTGMEVQRAGSQLFGWPIPVADHLYLNAPASGAILDAEGRTIYTLRRTNVVGTVNLAPGCYVLRTEEGATLRFVRE